VNEENSLIKDIGRSYIVSSFIPAALFISVCILIFKEYLTFPTMAESSNDKDLFLGQWFIFTIVTVWVAFSLYSISDWTVRLFEGYFFPKPVQVILVFFLREFWYKGATKYIKALNEIPNIEENILKRAPFMEKAFLEYANFGRFAPVVSSSLLPTRFGNIIYSSEEYPLDRYKIRGLGMWTRLAQVLPVNFRGQLEEKNNQMIFLLNSSLMSYIIGTVSFLVGFLRIFFYFTLGFAYLGARLLGITKIASDLNALLQSIAIATSIEYLFVGILMLVLGYIFYSFVLPVAEGFGTLVRTAYDLYRFDLLRQLNQEIPSNDEEEGILWHRLSQLFIAGRNYTVKPLQFSYSARNDLLDYTDLDEYKKFQAKKSTKKKKKKGS